MPDKKDVLLIEDRGAVRVLRMNRPEKLNALNTELTQALLQALLAADADADVSAVVLTGQGAGFCAGADIGEFKGLSDDGLHAQARANLTSRLHIQVQQMTKPVVAAAKGAAVGGGAGLAIACDMLIVGDDLRFGYPELLRGLVPAVVMTGLQRQIGRKLAFELISTGRTLGAQEVFDAGLANRIVPPDEVVDAALTVARGWAQANRAAMSASKELFYRVADLHFEAAMALGRDINIRMRKFSNS